MGRRETQTSFDVDCVGRRKHFNDVVGRSGRNEDRITSHRSRAIEAVLIDQTPRERRFRIMNNDRSKVVYEIPNAPSGNRGNVSGRGEVGSTDGEGRMNAIEEQGVGVGLT